MVFSYLGDNYGPSLKGKICVFGWRDGGWGDKIGLTQKDLWCFRVSVENHFATDAVRFGDGSHKDMLRVLWRHRQQGLWCMTPCPAGRGY